MLLHPGNELTSIREVCDAGGLRDLEADFVDGNFGCLDLLDDRCHEALVI